MGLMGVFIPAALALMMVGPGFAQVAGHTGLSPDPDATEVEGSLSWEQRPDRRWEPTRARSAEGRQAG